MWVCSRAYVCWTFLLLQYVVKYYYPCATNLSSSSSSRARWVNHLKLSAACAALKTSQERRKDQLLTDVSSGQVFFCFLTEECPEPPQKLYAEAAAVIFWAPECFLGGGEGEQRLCTYAAWALFCGHIPVEFFFQHICGRISMCVCFPLFLSRSQLTLLYNILSLWRIHTYGIHLSCWHTFSHRLTLIRDDQSRRHSSSLGDKIIRSNNNPKPASLTPFDSSSTVKSLFWFHMIGRLLF